MTMSLSKAQYLQQQDIITAKDTPLNLLPLPQPAQGESWKPGAPWGGQKSFTLCYCTHHLEQSTLLMGQCGGIAGT